MRRGPLLLLLAVAGAAIGAVGFAFSGHEAWYLALPAVLAAGWWFIADPTQCAPPSRRGDRDAP
jgi:hypothetical protein